MQRHGAVECRPTTGQAVDIAGPHPWEPAQNLIETAEIANEKTEDLPQTRPGRDRMALFGVAACTPDVQEMTELCKMSLETRHRKVHGRSFRPERRKAGRR